jgi:hypothetical protein
VVFWVLCLFMKRMEKEELFFYPEIIALVQCGRSVLSRQAILKMGRIMRYRKLLLLSVVFNCFLVTETLANQFGLGGELYTIKRVGLFEEVHTGLGGLQSSTLSFYSKGGYVSGFSNRFFTIDKSVNGINTWAYNPITKTTVQTGITGPAQTGSFGLQYGENQFQSATGHVAGFSFRYIGPDTRNGQNTWVYNPLSNTTTVTGFTGMAHTRSDGFQFSENRFQNASGQIAGRSLRYAGSNDNGADGWVYIPETGTTVQIGLTGDSYTSSTGRQLTTITNQNEAGHVVGSSMRFAGANTDIGLSTWIYDPSSKMTRQIGLVGAGFTGANDVQSSEVSSLNDVGGVIGSSVRYSASGTQAGHATWVYDHSTGMTVRTGLTGPGQTSSSGNQISFNRSINSAGFVTGSSTAYSGIAGDIGTHSWIYNPVTKTVVQTGLTTADHTGSDGRQISQNISLGASGYAVGLSIRFLGQTSQKGQNIWFYNPETNTTTPIGLTTPFQTSIDGVQSGGVDYFQSITGQVAGYSSRVVNNGLMQAGRNTWYYNPLTGITVQTGLTGAIHTSQIGAQDSRNNGLGSGGHVIGTSNRYNQTLSYFGRNTWMYNPITNTTVQTDYVSAIHTGSGGEQYGTNHFVTPDGFVVGSSRRYSGATSNGLNTWYYSPETQTTSLIGLTGDLYEGSDGYEESYYSFRLGNEFIAGHTLRSIDRFSNHGRDAWYFDLSTEVTSAIIGSVRTIDNYAFSQATMFAEGGFLLGNYTYFEGGIGAGEQRAFIFRPDLGLTDLGNLVDGGLTANGWAKLQSPLFTDALNTIVGYGYVNGQTSGQSVFIMTVIPEPSCVGLLAICGVMAGRRREVNAKCEVLSAKLRFSHG